jgi:hypothetical protein
MNEEIRCEHCGEICVDDEDLQIGHRSCRLKAAFPGDYKTDGPLVIFDMKKIKERLKL